ncbi:MAG: ABC-F type ribosomal protection protein [Bacilli bacterium]|nr:ABC-F type ribosomal protection protein [Bacilli bacterium]MDD4077945.1 ABC-F type ribosomal protection protein [Bacilli bacterium]MDD4388230.1 ABC-F type ribosomal protection protein [Bacilli bacterium]
MAQIKVNNLTFSYPGSYLDIFKNVSFQIDTDWKLGFIGRNGRGKTTFLNLLMEKYPYQGTINSPLDYEYFPFLIKDSNPKTVDIAADIVGYLQDWQLVCELNKLEVDSEVLNRSFNTLSEGERTKILLASLFLKEHRFLLIDEPTNHLDFKSRQVVADYLTTKKGFILVSHDRHFLDCCVDHILSINKANIEVQKGDFSRWYYNKQLQDNYEIQENKRLQQEIKRLNQAAQRTSKWSYLVEKTKIGSKGDKGYIGHKAAKMMKRSKTIEARVTQTIAEKTALLKDIETQDELKLLPLSYHSPRLVDFNGVTMYYGMKQVGPELTFSINQGDRVAIIGNNGSGKSTLLKLIVETTTVYQGYFRKGSNLIISYVPQSTADLTGNLSDYADTYQINESLFKAILRKLDFTRDHFVNDIKNFSSGQKKKVLIARSLCQQAHLYIWDEPLNYIDVFSRIQIEDLLLSCQATVVFVEHDAAFVDRIATKKIYL